MKINQICPTWMVAAASLLVAACLPMLCVGAVRQDSSVGRSFMFYQLDEHQHLHQQEQKSIELRPQPSNNNINQPQVIQEQQQQEQQDEAPRDAQLGQLRSKTSVSSTKSNNNRRQLSTVAGSPRRPPPAGAVGVKGANEALGGRNASLPIDSRASRANKKKLVCYYGSWAVYRPDAGRFPVEAIDPFLCTHIIYGFTGLSYDNLIKPLDPWNDLEDNYGKGAMKRFTGLKRQNPDLKTLVAIGGWNEGSIKYSKMAADANSRRKFVSSVVELLDRFGFDGLDLDWEYPGGRGGAREDKRNLVELLGELRRELEPRGYLLTMAVAAGKAFAEPAYDIARVAAQLDMINLMSYDYHGGWETQTGHNAPLFHSPVHDKSAVDRQLNVNWSVNYWLSNGAPASKIMLGTGSYGRSFTLDKEHEHGIGAPASQRGRAGPYTREPGSLGYNEICESLATNSQGWTVVRDPDYLAPYAYSGRQWVGYDDPESIKLKAEYANSMGLGGVMMWSLETDDFQGKCHGGERFPLLRTVRRVLYNEEGGPATPPPVQISTTSTSTTTRRPQESTSTSTVSTTTGREVEGSSSTTSTTSTPFRPSTSRRPTRPPSPPQTSRRPRPPTTSSTTTTSTTSTSTTTSSPQPSQDAEFMCRADGMFADPANCRKFYRCVSFGGAQEFTTYSFDCAPGTAFNEAAQYCDYVYNVPRCRQERPKFESAAPARQPSSSRRRPAQAQAGVAVTAVAPLPLRPVHHQLHHQVIHPALARPLGPVVAPLAPLPPLVGHHHWSWHRIGAK